MGKGYDAICNECGTKFQVNEGSAEKCSVCLTKFSGLRSK
jgi:hypothetical protein